MKKVKTLSVIIRASGESTLHKLISILNKQLLPDDRLEVLNEEVSFEKKLRVGFEKALEFERDYTVFVDADILVRKNALQKVRSTIDKLSERDYGFGFLLLDRFYEEPKFRGFHVYKTKILSKAINYIPKEGSELRPESYVKRQLENDGLVWRNHLTRYIAGIHDFYQNPKDIFYKFLIRSKRSPDDTKKLKNKFIKSKEFDFIIALKGIKASENMSSVINNKYLYDDIYQLPDRKVDRELNIISVDFIIIKFLFRKYKLGKLFWGFFINY